jgi:hypothetical protein
LGIGILLFNATFNNGPNRLWLLGNSCSDGPITWRRFAADVATELIGSNTLYKRFEP